MSANDAMPAVSVISPMYNESVNIARALRAMREALERLPDPWEFILVNDGSVDDSLAVARDEVGDDPRIRIISYEKNRGRGYAIRQGFAAARGAFLVVTEADLSWGTDIVGRLLEACKQPGVDMVVASPHMEGGKLENVPAYRAFLTNFGNVLLRRLMPGGLTMNTGMTRAYRRTVVDALDLSSDGKELHLEIISKAHALGFRMIEIPAALAWTIERRQEKRRFRARGLIASHILHGLAESPMTLFGWAGGLLLSLGLLGLLSSAAMVLCPRCASPAASLPILSGVSAASGILVLLAGFVATTVRDLRREVYRLQRRILAASRYRTRREGTNGASAQTDSTDADGPR